MEISYEQIINKICISEKIVPLLPEGCVMSPLCPGIYDNRKCDCFFVISEDHSEKMELSKAICYDFTQDEVLCCNDISAIITKIADNELLEDTYLNLYPKIKEIAFKGNLTAEELSIASDYNKSWEGFIENSLKDLFRLYFPLFFDWNDQHLSRNI